MWLIFSCFNCCYLYYIFITGTFKWKFIWVLLSPTIDFSLYLFLCLFTIWSLLISSRRRRLKWSYMIRIPIYALRSFVLSSLRIPRLTLSTHVTHWPFRISNYLRSGHYTCPSWFYFKLTLILGFSSRCYNIISTFKNSRGFSIVISFL